MNPDRVVRIAAPGEDILPPEPPVLPPAPQERNWTSPFPPERPVRSYMMDVSESDVVELPERSVLAAMRDVAEPLSHVPEEAWKPHVGREEPPRVGLVLMYLLHVTAEVNAGGRTPCREEHSIIVHTASDEPRAPVVVCPIVTWEDHTRYRPELQTDEALRLAQTGQTRGLLPVLLPRRGYEGEPQAFIWLAVLWAIPYREAARFGHGEEGSLRLKEEFAPRLAATFGRAMASSS